MICDLSAFSFASGQLYHNLDKSGLKAKGMPLKALPHILSNKIVYFKRILQFLR